MFKQQRVNWIKLFKHEEPKHIFSLCKKFRLIIFSSPSNFKSFVTLLSFTFRNMFLWKWRHFHFLNSKWQIVGWRKHSLLRHLGNKFSRDEVFLIAIRWFEHIAINHSVMCLNPDLLACHQLKKKGFFSLGVRNSWSRLFIQNYKTLRERWST